MRFIGALQGTFRLLRILVARAEPLRHLEPKNSPPDCFLNGSTLSGSSLCKYLFSMKKADNFRYLLSYGALQGTRTPDLLVRSQTLYPAELAAHFWLRTFCAYVYYHNVFVLSSTFSSFL